MTTGKNKVEFKEFYETITGGNYKIPYQNFMAYPPEMQKGVYEAYYDSVGINIGVDRDYDFVEERYTDDWDSGFLYDGNYTTVKGYYKTRLEAFAEALKMADKLRNEQLNR